MTAIGAQEAPPSPRPAPALWTLGRTTLDARKNGLNLLRLVFAAMVLVAHGWYLSGKGHGPMLNGENLGGWAVFGFFAISGYLITGSRLGNSFGTFLVHRVARIFPAFLVCLVVTAFVLAPIGYLHQHHTIDGFLTTGGTTPINYLILNAGLKIQAYDVAGTPAGVPFPGAWDGSLWTLYYEFLCYIIVGVLCVVAAVRRNWIWIALAWAFSTLTYAAINRIAPYTGGNNDLFFLTKLMPFFLAGALLFLLRDKIPLTWPIAVASLVISTVLVLKFHRYGPQFAAPFLSYAVLWLGAVLPCPDVIRRHDVSYGVYIYAWPVQELFALAGVAVSLPLFLYDGLAFLATIPIATASWLLVERPLMRRARRSTRPATTPTIAPPPAAMTFENALASATTGTPAP